MKKTPAIVCALLIAVAVAACGGGSSGGTGGNTTGGGSTTGGGGAAGACLLQSGGHNVFCWSWSNIPANIQSTYCSAASGYTSVSSCPTAGKLGTCTFTSTSSSNPFTIAETFYDLGGGFTASQAQQACTQAGNASVTTSWST